MKLHPAISIYVHDHQTLQPFFRRWIFGSSGLTTRGLHVDGTNNDGVNTHYYPEKQSAEDEPLIAMVGVGAESVNQTSINIMGDFRYVYGCFAVALLIHSILMTNQFL